MPSYLTQNDVDNYGSDLLDVSQRAALQAVAPHLQDLQQQNVHLQRQLAKEARHRLDQAVERAVPDFREIDRNPRWHRWLLGIDALTGKVRQLLLNDAVASGSVSRVKAFFNGFKAEEADQARAPSGSSRQARSFGKPTSTREQIGQLYEQHRKGAYTGREDEWNKIEADIFAAQREGRVQGPPYLTK
jgi:hypothetical protein